MSIFHRQSHAKRQKKKNKTKRQNLVKSRSPLTDRPHGSALAISCADSKQRTPFFWSFNFPFPQRTLEHEMRLATATGMGPKLVKSHLRVQNGATWLDFFFPHVYGFFWFFLASSGIGSTTALLWHFLVWNFRTCHFYFCHGKDPV